MAYSLDDQLSTLLGLAVSLGAYCAGAVVGTLIGLSYAASELAQHCLKVWYATRGLQEEPSVGTVISVVVVAGADWVGLPSLARMYALDDVKVPPRQRPITGADLHQKELLHDGLIVFLQIWEIGDDMSSLGAAFCNNADGWLLVGSACSKAHLPGVCTATPRQGMCTPPVVRLACSGIPHINMHSNNSAQKVSPDLNDIVEKRVFKTFKMSNTADLQAVTAAFEALVRQVLCTRKRVDTWIADVEVMSREERVVTDLEGWRALQAHCNVSFSQCACD